MTQASDLSGLELRRAVLIALGQNSEHEDIDEFQKAFPIESDSGESEEELIRLCRKHNVCFILDDVHKHQLWEYQCLIVTLVPYGLTVLATAHGATPSEARCRAIVAFCEAQKGKA